MKLFINKRTNVCSLIPENVFDGAGSKNDILAVRINQEIFDLLSSVKVQHYPKEVRRVMKSSQEIPECKGEVAKLFQKYRSKQLKIMSQSF
ncbi:MAG: hypothetical protein PHS92_04400 [Candidatus Gracilibacteria bacterium]|nr:hypothetical protein [Candidatus Gracilibacteria bacterium]